MYVCAYISSMYLLELLRDECVCGLRVARRASDGHGAGHCLAGCGAFNCVRTAYMYEYI